MASTLRDAPNVSPLPKSPPILGDTGKAPGGSFADLAPGHPRDLQRTRGKWEGKGSVRGRLLPMPDKRWLSPDGVYLPIVDEEGNPWWLLVGEGAGSGGKPLIDLGAVWQALVFGPTRPNPNDAREALDIPGTSLQPGNFGAFCDLNALSTFYWHRNYAWKSLGFTTDEQPLLGKQWLDVYGPDKPAGVIFDPLKAAILAAVFDGAPAPFSLDDPPPALDNFGRAALPLSYGAVDYDGRMFRVPQALLAASTENAPSLSFAKDVDGTIRRLQEIQSDFGYKWNDLLERTATIWKIPIKCVPFPGTNFDGSYWAVGDAWSRICVLVSRNLDKWPASSLPVAPGKIKAQFDEMRTVEIVKESFNAVGGLVTGILTYNFQGLVDGLTNAVNGPVLQQLRLQETTFAAQADTVRAVGAATGNKLVELALHGPSKPVKVAGDKFEELNRWMTVYNQPAGTVLVWGEWRLQDGTRIPRWVRISGLDGSPVQVSLDQLGALRYRGTPAWEAGPPSFADVDPRVVVGIPGGPYEGLTYATRNQSRGISPAVVAALAAGALLLL